MLVSGGEAFVAVDVADFCLDASGISKSAEEFIRGQMSEPDSIHASTLAEDKLAGVEGKHGITYPGSFALDFQKFITGHAASVYLGSWLGKFFPFFLFDFSAQAVFGFGIPVAGLQFHEDRGVWKRGGCADDEHFVILVCGIDEGDE